MMDVKVSRLEQVQSKWLLVPVHSGSKYVKYMMMIKSRNCAYAKSTKILLASICFVKLLYILWYLSS